ncbi:hypothetical protein [Flavobacterium daemonense]|uniref:hypothetical protein n=1 Tax=Flavobacterium daemonense TaxID=1393049 RepID=UPI001185D30F|nr:hypothetical protein [Flavobacterium daemonense]KAF2337218.1 hypothetical protein FND99_02055 [Flavobacterium daemonense]
MENEVQKAISVDEHILNASGLVKDKRGYNAMLNLLQNGLLMYERLGVEDTGEFIKVLDHIGLEWRFFDGGIELVENAKTKYYIREIHNKQPPHKPLSKLRTYVEGEGWLRTRNSDFLNEKG